MVHKVTVVKLLVSFDSLCLKKMNRDMDIEERKKQYPIVDFSSCMDLSNYTSASSVQFLLYHSFSFYYSLFPCFFGEAVGRQPLTSISSLLEMETVW